MVRVFISYSWDSEQHKDWVRRLARGLSSGGLNVQLDQLDLRPGADLTRYMESAVRESDYVLLVCTPEFASRADGRVGGVGYEQSIVTGEIIAGVGHDEKFIPVLRGDPETSIPSFLRSRVWADFSEEVDFEVAVRELIEQLTSGGPAEVLEGAASWIDDDLRVYERAVESSRSRTGLAYSRVEADEFARWCQENWTLVELDLFVEVFEFAKDEMKLSRADSERFALDWLDRDDDRSFDTYSDAFLFAVERAGLGLRPYQARDFVEEFVEDPGLDYFYRFEQAFTVARRSGKSRPDAEDFAYQQL